MTEASATENFGFQKHIISRWTPLAVQTLEDMWGKNCTYDEMSIRLGVSIGALTSKARLLGLPKRNYSPEWSDGNVEELRRLWTKGDSCSQIGIALGRTRNAIIGKVHRLGLEGRAERLTGAERIVRRAQRKSRQREYINQKQREYRARQEKTEKLATVTEPWLGSRNISFGELALNECHFPFGDGPYLFCGQPALIGASYCAHCYAVAHRYTPASYARPPVFVEPSTLLPSLTRPDATNKSMAATFSRMVMPAPPRATSRA